MALWAPAASSPEVCGGRSRRDAPRPPPGRQLRGPAPRDRASGATESIAGHVSPFIRFVPHRQDWRDEPGCSRLPRAGPGLGAAPAHGGGGGMFGGG